MWFEQSNELLWSGWTTKQPAGIKLDLHHGWWNSLEAVVVVARHNPITIPKQNHHKHCFFSALTSWMMCFAKLFGGGCGVVSLSEMNLNLRSSCICRKYWKVVLAGYLRTTAHSFWRSYHLRNLQQTNMIWEKWFEDQLHLQISQ